MIVAAARRLVAQRPPLAGLSSRSLSGARNEVSEVSEATSHDERCAEIEASRQPGTSLTPETILNHIPVAQRNRPLIIHQPRKAAMQSGKCGEKSWRFHFTPMTGWTNQLMGWPSSRDSLSQSGASRIRFESKEQAVEFAEKQGWKYEVRDRAEDDECLGGEKDYGHNFLNYHEKTRMKRMTVKQFAKTQFNHKEAGKTAWVNLEHTPHGPKESTMVSGTQWKDVTNHAGHGAESWRTDGLEKSMELARKIGK